MLILRPRKARAPLARGRMTAFLSPSGNWQHGHGSTRRRRCRIDAENNAMKWGSLLWLCCLTAGEIGRQPSHPLTEEQKRRRQQYIADKKAKRARQPSACAGGAAAAPGRARGDGAALRRGMQGTPREDAPAMACPTATPPTNHIPLGPREPRFALRFLRVTKTQNCVLRDPEGRLHGVYKLMCRLEGDPHWWKDPHFRTDASTLLKRVRGKQKPY